MKIGVPAETRPGETRIAATPETIKKLLLAKHQVVVQSGAGLKSSMTDEAYLTAGAQIGSAADAYACELVLKVRAPSAQERELMAPGTVVTAPVARLFSCTVGLAAMKAASPGLLAGTK